MISDNGGQLQGSQRKLAEQAGVSKSVLNRALHELQAIGAVSVTADRLAGTVVRLKVA